jgi:signal transduction histidine kinase
MGGFSEQIVLPHLWRRYLSFMRALVGATCIWVVLASSGLNRPRFLLLLAALCAYSLITVVWRWPERVDIYELLNFLLDLQCFLLCVALTPESGFWICAIAGFYLFLAAATLHEWREVLLLLVICLGFVGWIEPAFSTQLAPLILLLGMFSVVLALQRKALLDRLSSSSRQAVMYRSQAERAREAERERIAADLHDGPLQAFISVQMRLAILKKILQKTPQAAPAELDGLHEITTKLVTEVRTFIRGMRPVEVEGAGMASSLRTLVGTFQKDTGIPATFQADPSASHDDLEATIDLVQVLREALNNVQKHSSASRVSVQLSRRDNVVEIEIEDDGRGFPFAGTWTLEELDLLKLGPASIKRRVRSMNGDLTIESRPGRGAGLKIRLPAA